MDSSIVLSYGSKTTDTRISNIFIDNYMADARGSDVKVYLYLLRCIQDPSRGLSLASMAEALNDTEKEIRNALEYWNRVNVLSLKFTRGGQISDITVRDLDCTPEETEDFNGNISGSAENLQAVQAHTSAPEKAAPGEDIPSGSSGDEKTKNKASEIVRPNYSVEMIAGFSEYPGWNELIDHIENIFGKTLSHRDLQTAAFLFEDLGMSAELIRYLYSYCFSLQHKTNAYIEKVARSWHDGGVVTIDDAKRRIAEFTNKFSAVKNSFGIRRSFGSAEIDFMFKWYDEYGLSEDVIREACSRTIIDAGNPSFKYADKILTDWHKNNIRTIADIKAKDLSFSQSKKENTQKNPQYKINQFMQHEYSHEDNLEIEKKKLGIL